MDFNRKDRLRSRGRGILSVERDAVVWLHREWGDVDKATAQPAHRGSHQDLVHVSESTVWRVGGGPRSAASEGEWPPLEKIRDPAQLEVELEAVRTEHNTVLLHAGIDYVTPDDEHNAPFQ